jgi:maltooligosyltrehalose trehalohydrolase
VKRRHSMPFGAECQEDGSVRFRLWAPAARKVEVCVTGKQQLVSLVMHPRDDGWFELSTTEAKTGSYCYFRIDGEKKVPDPASRFQPQDVHGPSEVIDPSAFEWSDDDWRGRRWEEAVIYELHVGTFTPAGTFSSARDRLDYLADLGVSAIELMPVADFPGRRNWGYDGVLPFAPDSSYGRPEDLKEFIQNAHRRGMMVLLDVVYNHFGPEGNYLGSYAPYFFTDRHHTPWGNGINYDGTGSRTVRDFFINNALYWLNEYNLDGLRLDAVHAIADDSHPQILTELTQVIRSSLSPDRNIHLILENDRNESRFLHRSKHCQPHAYTAQWNDDIHHALHVLLTGERDGYYSDYSDSPLDQLGRCLVEGFAFQGEESGYRKGEARGEPTAGLPPGAFVAFLQNHDQVGNRAFGERIVSIANCQSVRAAVAILLLAPSPPLLFMGEEFGAETPFLFFCDFEDKLAAAVTSGRRNEFARFLQFSDPAERERIPDPGAISTFEASRLNWADIDCPRHRNWFNLYRDLLKLRHHYIVPRLSASCTVNASSSIQGRSGLVAQWKFADDSQLLLRANLGTSAISDLDLPASQIIYASQEIAAENLANGVLPPWTVAWFFES